MSVDPARQFASPYVGMGNNPVVGFDPDGRDCPSCPNDQRFDAYRNNNAMFGYDPDIGVYSDMGVGVTGTLSWFDNIVRGLMHLDDRYGGTHGYEFMNSGWGGTPIYLQRKGKSLGIIVDPAEGLVVFKHNGYKYKIDNKTPVTSTTYKAFLNMLSDSKYVAVDLRGSTDKVIKLVEDNIINNHGLLKLLTSDSIVVERYKNWNDTDMIPMDTILEKISIKTNKGRFLN